MAIATVVESAVSKVPTWGWLLAGGAVIGLGYRVLHEQSAADVAANDEDSAQGYPDVGSPPAAGGYGGGYGGGYIAPPSPAPITPVVPDISEVAAIGKTALQGLSNSTQALLQSNANAIGGALDVSSNALDSMRSTSQSALSSIEGVSESALDNLTESNANALQAYQESNENALKSFQDFATNGLHSIGDLASGAVGAVVGIEQSNDLADLIAGAQQRAVVPASPPPARGAQHVKLTGKVHVVKGSASALARKRAKRQKARRKK
jgi:hypothetical protein